MLFKKFFDASINNNLTILNGEEKVFNFWNNNFLPILFRSRITVVFI